MTTVTRDTQGQHRNTLRNCYRLCASFECRHMEYSSFVRQILQEIHSDRMQECSQQEDPCAPRILLLAHDLYRAHEEPWMSRDQFVRQVLTEVSIEADSGRGTSLRVQYRPRTDTYRVICYENGVGTPEENALNLTADGVHVLIRRLRSALSATGVRTE